MEEFSVGFLGRINSLSQTHSLLTGDYKQAASLREILTLQLGPYRDGSARQVTVEGPAVDLPSELAVPISMAVHELATNAAKYGALSVDGGELAVTWTLQNRQGEPCLHLEWRERNRTAGHTSDAGRLRHAAPRARAGCAGERDCSIRFPAGRSVLPRSDPLERLRIRQGTQGPPSPARDRASRPDCIAAPAPLAGIRSSVFR